MKPPTSWDPAPSLLLGNKDQRGTLPLECPWGGLGTEVLVTSCLPFPMHGVRSWTEPCLFCTSVSRVPDKERNSPASPARLPRASSALSLSWMLY